MQVTAWSLPSLAAVWLAAHTLRHAYARIGVAGAGAMVLLSVSVMLWSAGQLLGTLTTDLDAKILFSKLQYPAIALLPVAWFAFALTYTQRIRSVASPLLITLSALPIMTIVMAWTNELHQLVWAAARLETTAGFVGLALEYGPWFHLNTAYAYALVIAGTLILAYELSASHRHRRALVAVVLAPLIVIALNLVYLTDWNYPLPFIDPTPLGLALATAVMAHGLLHSGLLSLSPALHREVVEQLEDAVVVLDAEGVIIDANPAGMTLLVPEGGAAIGHPIDTLLPHQHLSRLGASQDAAAEATVDLRTYHVRASRLAGNGDRDATVVLVFRDLTERLEALAELRKVKLELERLSYTDALTGLHNRRSFMERMHQECERVRRQQQTLTLVMLDLNRFKDVNERFGHEIGDQVLRHVARQVQQCSRVCDVSARLGGEEFGLLLPGTDRDGALRLAERLRLAIADYPFRDAQGSPFHITASIGVATADDTEADWQSLLRRADEALHRAKRSGPDTVSGEPRGLPPTGMAPRDEA